MSRSVLNSLLILFCLLPAFARATVVETHGDSLAEGFFAGTHLRDPFPEVKERRAELRTYAMTKKIFPRVAQQKLAIQHDPAKAWPSYLAGLVAGRYSDVRLVNRGKTMARAVDISAQVVGSDPNERVFAFFFMGHNDLCESPQKPPYNLQRIVNEYHAGLATWDANHRNARAFLVPVGDIPKIYRTLDREVWNQKPNGKCLNCWAAWEHFFPFCKQFTRLHAEGRLEAEVGTRRRDLNNALGTLADHWNKIGRRGNTYVYLAGALDEDYFPRYFGADCFHLSAEGGYAVAESIFRRAFPFL